MRFKIATDNLVASEAVDAADFVTFDGRVISAQSRIVDGNVLECFRRQSDSSKLRLLCNLPGRRMVLTTTSLRETDAPYSLELELARGELSRLRNFYHLWTGAGLKSSPELDSACSMAHEAFRKGIFSDDKAKACLETIELAHKAVSLLTQLYTKQRITYRLQKNQKFPMFVGCRITNPPVHEEHFLEAFNSVMLSTDWAEMEPSDGNYNWERLNALADWCVARRRSVIAGPLLDLSTDKFPAWLAPWKTDPVNLESFAAGFVETTVSEFVGRIRHWEVVCGANRGGASTLSEEQRLNLVARVIEAAHHVDEQIQISLRVVQPWGEYLNSTANRLPAIQFVDMLRRSGADIAEVNLDLRFGTGPLDSLYRDMLNVSQLLDHWSLLQMPINVMASVPRGFPGMDPVERIQYQMQYLEELLLMCLSKERVTGFYCMNWNDAQAADEPLVDKDNSLHPAVVNLAALERTHWRSLT